MATWINLMDVIYPVGSFYISQQSTSPASIIGGSWTQVTNAVLRGSTSIGYIGSDTHTLTVNEMPSHQHSIQVTTWCNAFGGLGIACSNEDVNYLSNPSHNFEGWSTGGGGSTFNCATLLQLFYLVQNGIESRVVM